MRDDNDEEPSGDLTATDPTGCVQVSMDRESGRVVDFRLSALWRGRLGAAGMADALIHAIAEVRASYLESWLEEGHRDVGTPSTPSAPTFPPEALKGLTSGEQQEAWHRMADLLNSVSAEATATRERIQSANEDKPTYAGSDGNRKVSVALSAAAVLAGLTIDERWLGSASTERVVNGLREAFESAYATFDRAGCDQATATPVADQAAALISDPTRLVRWLRQED